jgi:hypothetical protein
MRHLVEKLLVLYIKLIFRSTGNENKLLTLRNHLKKHMLISVQKFQKSIHFIYFISFIISFIERFNFKI